MISLLQNSLSSRRLSRRLSFSFRLLAFLFCGLFSLSACNNGNNSPFIIDLGGNTPPPTTELPTSPGTGAPSAPIDNDTRISAITVSLGNLNIEFAPRIKDYVLLVDGEAESVTVNATLFNTNSSIWVNGIQIESGRDIDAPLHVGETALKFLVVADDGDYDQYTLTITRSKPDEYFVIGYGSGIAIPMTYHARMNHQKFISLAAYSNDITYKQADFTDIFTDYSVHYRQAISQWNIRSLPDNGKLYDDQEEIVILPHNASDPDAILYVPNSDFTGTDTFSFSVQDSTGESELSNINIIVDNNVTVPLGIASLPGIFNTQAPIAMTSGNTETNDWYIDNSHLNATDTLLVGELEPRQGTPDVPRLTLPPDYAVIPAGTNIFIKGGVETPYTLPFNSYRWALKGTAEKPVYIIGTNNGPHKPVIDHQNTELHLEAEYAIIDGIHFKGYIVQTNQLGYESGEIVIRHSIIDGLHQPTNLTLNSHLSNSMNYGGNKIFYDTIIRNAGDKFPSNEKQIDVPGIEIRNANGFWILDSLLHDNEGSAIKIDAEIATNINIARNKIHSNFENAINVKDGENVLFVNNDIWDHRAFTYESSETDGAAISVTQSTDSEKTSYSTIARNRIWGANIAIKHQGQHLWVNDNIFWNIHQNVASSTLRYAIDISHPREVNSSTHIINNTFDNINNGILTSGINNNNINEFVIKGNIFGDFNALSIEREHYRLSEFHIENTSTDYNFYVSPLKIQWGTNQPNEALNLTTYRQNTPNATASLHNIDPLFINKDNFNLRLQPLSLGIGANIEHQIYTLFFNQYGRSLNQDLDGNNRPINGSWDIGAFEQ